MKILHFIPSFSGGGAERQLSLLASQQAMTDCEIHIAYLYSGVNIGLVSKNVILHKISCLSNYDPIILLKIYNIIKKVNPLVVQTWLPQMDILVGLVCLLSGRKHIITERSSKEAYKSKWRIMARNLVAKNAVSIVSNSNSGAEYWSSYSNKVSIISNGIVVNSVIKKIVVRQNKILCAGRFSYEKNFLFLIEGLDIVLREWSDYYVTLSGEGPLEKEIKKIINNSDLSSKFTLKGYDSNLQDSLREAYMYVSASHFEGFPNIVLEAMISGCPLVVSDIPEHREILTPNMAVFFKPNSLTDFNRAVSSVLADYQGATKRAVLAKEHAYRYKIENSATAYLELYSNFK